MPIRSTLYQIIGFFQLTTRCEVLAPCLYTGEVVTPDIASHDRALRRSLEGEDSEISGTREWAHGEKANGLELDKRCLDMQ